MSPQWADFILGGDYFNNVQFKFDTKSSITCPPTSHTVKLMFLYSTVSTLNPTKIMKAVGGKKHLRAIYRWNLPIVGIVVTTSPNLSLYRIVVYEYNVKLSKEKQGDCQNTDLEVNGDGLK